MNRVSGTCGAVNNVYYCLQERQKSTVLKTKLKKYWLNFNERHKSKDSRSSANSKQIKSPKIATPPKETAINERKR